MPFMTGWRRSVSSVHRAARAGYWLRSQALWGNRAADHLRRLTRRPLLRRPADWTIGSGKRGVCAERSACHMSRLDLVLRVWPGVRRAGRQGRALRRASGAAGAALTSTRRGADKIITDNIDAHVEAEHGKPYGDDGAAGVLVPVG